MLTLKTLNFKKNNIIEANGFSEKTKIKKLIIFIKK